VLTAPEGYTAGDYRIAFQRTTGVTGCAAFPSGASSVSFTGGRFTTCLGIPAGGHSTSEVLSFVRTAGTGRGLLTVYDAAGTVACVSAEGTSRIATCDLADGQAYTVLMSSSLADTTFRVSRRDTSPAASCTTVASTRIGSTGATGTATARDDIHCYQITPAATTDVFWVALRAHGTTGRYWATDAAGNELDCYFITLPCRFTGSTGYRIFVWGDTDSAPVPYEVDAWKIGGAGALPAECPVVSSTAWGFGTFSGALDSGTPAVCRQVTVKRGNEFRVVVGNTEDENGVTPDAYLVTGGAIRECAPSSIGGRDCAVDFTETADKVLFILWGGSELERYPYKAVSDCYTPLCGGATFTASGISPASAPAAGKTTITVSGTALGPNDEVQLTASGVPPITATVTSASADWTTLTVSADLTGAAAGVRDVTVHSASGPAVNLPGAFTVTTAPVRNTAVPTITGTVQVGSTVTAVPGTWVPATATYGYQWYLDGTRMRGAQNAALPLTGAMGGHQLTVVVLARADGYSDGTATSAAALVALGPPVRNTTLPSIAGTPKVGRTVTAVVGAWTPAPTAYTYQWYLDGARMRGAQNATLPLTAAMAPHKLTVVVAAQSTGYADGAATSKAVNVTT
jgi:hypothetical protein